MYSSNTVFVIGKSQEKDGTELAGYNFNINIEKSRFVKEKSKLSFQVLFDKGIDRYSGLLDLAIENGNIIKPSNGWYQTVNKATGEIIEKKCRAKELFNNDEFWKTVIEDPSFKQYVKDKFQLGAALLSNQKSTESVESAITPTSVEDVSDEVPTEDAPAPTKGKKSKK